MANSLITGAAKSDSMSEFLAKARRLADVRPPEPMRGRARGVAAASRSRGPREAPSPVAEAMAETPAEGVSSAEDGVERAEAHHGVDH